MTGDEPRTPDSPPPDPKGEWTDAHQRHWDFVNWAQRLMATKHNMYMAINTAPEHLREYLYQRKQANK